MKLASSATMAAILLGVCAFVQSGTASALPPCQGGPCATWKAECNAGNQSACFEEKELCSGCPGRSATTDTPSTEHVDRDATLVDPRHLAVAK
jgi:hypothetical protein